MDRLRTLIRLCSGLGLLVAGWMGCARAPGVEVPYVQTPSEVVMEMLRLARVTPDDVVYDLGSGDGRLVIAAARYFGARGVGIELDPALVAESKKIARRAGVAERARFVEQDIFEADISEASVNARLRPKLQSQLRPGARIVSHDFPIGDWAPGRVVQFKGPERTHALSLWTIPSR